MIKKPPENFQRYFYQFMQIYECLHKPALSQVLSIQCEDTVPDLRDLRADRRGTAEKELLQIRDWVRQWEKGNFS